MVSDMSVEWRLKCHTCGAVFSSENAPLYLCPQCAPLNTPNAPLKGVCLCEYDYDDWAARMPREAAWDAVLLPAFAASRSDLPPLRVTGKTPLYSAAALARELGVALVSVKDETVEPSGSLKDRASHLVVSYARAHGFDTLTCASTGNAASSLATMCAAAHLTCHIFMSADAPRGKTVQLAATGARLHRIKGSYDDSCALCTAVAEKKGWYNRITAYNPWTIEGKKTVAWEIACQCDFNVPDYVLVPTGDGVILSGVWKGFHDLYRLGWITHLPQLIAVQPEGSAAITTAWEARTDGTKAYHAHATSLADSLVVDAPRNAALAISALNDTHGYALTVTDEEIRHALRDIGAATGIFVEPAAAAAYAGARVARHKGFISDNAHVALLLTGNGLKDIDGAEAAVSIPPAFALEDAYATFLGEG